MTLSFVINCSAQKYITLAQGPEDNYFTIGYRVVKGNVEFQYYYAGHGNRHMSVDVDVNKNGIVDNMLDRSYGSTGSGLNLKLCSQYLIDETTSTFCGVAPSKATIEGRLLRVDGNTNFKEYSIPKKELTTSSSNGIIHVRIQIVYNIGTVDNEIWVRTKYPECASDPDCTKLFDKVYEIKIK